jgi:precorrin-2/cobalt-factor-2 C20-methyltransferase
MTKAAKISIGKFYGIGIGPGDPDLLTIKAVKALEQADIIYVPKSKEQASTALNIVEKYLPENAVIEHLEFPMSHDIQTRIDSRKRNAKLISKKLDEGKVAVFLTLGDPMLYSTYSYVLEYLDSGFFVETIPGIYSFAAISSLLSLPLCKGEDKLVVISSFDEHTPKLIQFADTVVFMKVSAYYSELYNFLSKHPDYHFVMISDAGKTNQKIYKSIDILLKKVPYFSTIIIQKENLLNTKHLEICQA